MKDGVLQHKNDKNIAYGLVLEMGKHNIKFEVITIDPLFVKIATKDNDLEFMQQYCKQLQDKE